MAEMSRGGGNFLFFVPFFLSGEKKKNNNNNNWDFSLPAEKKKIADICCKN